MSTLQQPPAELIKRGEQFKSKRSKSTDTKTLTIVFEDELSVVLEGQSENGRYRRYEPRDQFESGIGNQWEYVGSDSTDESDETTEASRSDVEYLLSALENRRKSINKDESIDMTGVRGHEVDELISTLESNPKIHSLDLESVNGVGEKTAQNLRENGIKTNLDILFTGVEFLSDVDGVGEKTAENLIEKAESYNTIA